MVIYITTSVSISVIDEKKPKYKVRSWEETCKCVCVGGLLCRGGGVQGQTRWASHPDGRCLGCAASRWWRCSAPLGGLCCCTWEWECGCPGTGRPSWLACLAGASGFSAPLCCLWPLAWGHSVPVLLISTPRGKLEHAHITQTPTSYLNIRSYIDKLLLQFGKVHRVVRMQIWSWLLFIYLFLVLLWSDFFLSPSFTFAQCFAQCSSIIVQSFDSLMQQCCCK